jgi:hypothetical protein
MCTLRMPLISAVDKGAVEALEGAGIALHDAAYGGEVRGGDVLRCYSDHLGKPRDMLVETVQA